MLLLPFHKWSLLFQWTWTRLIKTSCYKGFTIVHCRLWNMVHGSNLNWNRCIRSVCFDGPLLCIRQSTCSMVVEQWKAINCFDVRRSLERQNIITLLTFFLTLIIFILYIFMVLYFSSFKSNIFVELRIDVGNNSRWMWLEWVEICQWRKVNERMDFWTYERRNE